MPTPGIDHEFKMLFDVLQFLHQLKAVLQVHVVVHGAMIDPEQSLVFICIGHDRSC